MKPADFLAILPFLILTGTAVVGLLAIAFHRRHGLTFGLALGGTLLSLASIRVAANSAPRQVTP